MTTSHFLAGVFRAHPLDFPAFSNICNSWGAWHAFGGPSSESQRSGRSRETQEAPSGNAFSPSCQVLLTPAPNPVLRGTWFRI